MEHPDDMPDFKSQVMELSEDELSSMSPADRKIHNSWVNIRREQSIRTQQMDHLNRKINECRRVLVDLQNTKKHIFGIPSRFASWLLPTVGAATIVKIIDLIK